MKKNISHILNFQVIIEQDKNNIFVATVPTIPGCHSQGNTYEEALKNIEEAIKLCLEVARDDDSYREQIDLNVQKKHTPRFLGIINLPIKLGFSL